MQLIALIWGGSSQSHVVKISNHNKAMKFAYFAFTVHVKCCQTVVLYGIQNLRFSTFNQKSSQQRDDDLRSPLMSASYANCLQTENLLFMAYGTQDFQHSIRTAATKRRQLMTVHANCLWTANLLFMEVTHLGNQNQKKLMHYM